jgi:hypothetical protein
MHGFVGANFLIMTSALPPGQARFSRRNHVVSPRITRAETERAREGSRPGAPKTLICAVLSRFASAAAPAVEPCEAEECDAE